MPALTTEDNVAAFMQSSSLDDDALVLAIATATALIEGYCRRSFTTAPAATTKRIRPDSRGRVRLPRPVTAVTSVNWVYATSSAETTVPALWQFDGLDTVWLTDIHHTKNRPESDMVSPAAVVVAFTTGWTTPPADVCALATSVAARLIGNPDGLKSETIGAYSYSLNSVPGGGAVLLPDDKLILDRYRMARAQTVSL